MRMNRARGLIAMLAPLLASMLLGAAVYELVVVAPNFQVDIPESLERLSQFYSVANPGTLFRVLAPATQLSLVLALVLWWRDPRRRWLYAVAVLGVVIGDVITFTYHYPRNEFLFTAPAQKPVPELVVAAREWATGNVARVLLVAVSSVTTLLALRNTAAKTSS